MKSKRKFLSFKPTNLLIYYIEELKKLYPSYSRVELFYLACKNFKEVHFLSEGFDFFELEESLFFDDDCEKVANIKEIPISIKFEIREDFLHRKMLEDFIALNISHYRIALVLFKSLLKEKSNSLVVNNIIKIDTNDLLTKISNLYLSNGNEKLKEIIKAIVLNIE